MRTLKQIIDFFGKLKAFLLLGCPCCYSLDVIKVNHYHRYCPKCNNSFDVRIWSENE